MSGITMDDKLRQQFEDLKIPKNKKLKPVWQIYGLNDACDKIEMILQDDCGCPETAQTALGQMMMQEQDHDDDRKVKVSRRENKDIWDTFIERLPTNKNGHETCAIVYDLEYSNDGVTKNKLFMIHWNPDTAGVRKRMVLSANLNNLKQHLSFPGKSIQASDVAEISLENLIEIAMKTTTK